MSRTATVEGSILFTDLVGFTEFTGAVGDLAALAVLEAQTAIARDVLARDGGGRVVKEIGDGMMLWFASPVVALGAAAGILGEIDGARSRGSFPLSVRMGLHHGTAVARGDDLVGQAVNIASRIADVAGPGELLLSDAVTAACGDDEIARSLTPIGAVHVKGVGDPIWLYRW
jgi:adenylate cyclase